LELVEKVRRGEQEIAMVSDFTDRAGVVVRPLGKMRCAWYCQPGLPVPTRPLSLAMLMTYPLVMQDDASAAGRLVLQWLASYDVQPGRVTYSNSFAALAGMTVAGLGIGCLPVALAKELLDRRLVRQIGTFPQTPAMAFVTVMRTGAPTSFLTRVADLAVKVCDYNTRYQDMERADVLDQAD
jgi:DNA-binding transcriptional LysR family regulator